MALALCLTLLPTAALAAEPNASETPDAAVAAVQARIDALPDAKALNGMDNDDALAAYDAVQAAYDAYEKLTEAQQAEITGADRFEALFGCFNEQVAPLADQEINPDGVDANGNIITDTGFSRTGPLLTASYTYLSGKYYIVQGNITINGDLTVNGNENGGLVLCDGATLTVNGALIHKGGGAFYIYGQTGSNGTGKLVIENSKGDGAAIRAAANAYNTQLGISSGVVELHGGSAKKLVDEVGLYSTSKIHKGTLNGNEVLPEKWCNSLKNYVTSIEGTSLVLAYCKHSDNAFSYVANQDGKTHHQKCNRCGFEWKEADAEHSAEAHTFRYETIDATYHKATCVKCGYVIEKQAHEIKTGSGNKVPTPDGTGHTDSACVCGYTSGTAEPHKYDSSTGKCTVCNYACPHKEVENGTCTVCQMTGIKATVGSTAYTDIAAAVTDWLANGGTLTLHADGGTDAFAAFGKAKTLTIDLNGHRINYNDNGSGTKVNLNGVALTIRDSKEKNSNWSAFGPINADSGTLTLESGYIHGLTVNDPSAVTLHLHGGNIYGITCSKPVYTLLDDGYALMNGNLTVGPTTILDGGSQTYTVKNAQLKNVQKGGTGSAAIGSNMIPFALSLETDDKDIGQMGFEWYCINSESKAATLLATFGNDVFPENGVYTFDPAKMKVDSINWSGLEANKTYDVLCVVIGKKSGGAYCWQTLLRGYTLTVTPASLNNDNTVIEVTNAGSLVYTGNKIEPTITVTYNGAELTKDKDYEVSYKNNTNAGTATVTVTGKGNYAGTKTVDFNIGRATLTVEGTGTASGTYGAKLSELTVSGLTAKMGGSEVKGTWSLTGDAVPNVGDTKTYTATFTPSHGVDNYLPLTKDDITLSIAKAEKPEKAEQTVTVTNNRAHTYAFDLSALLPKLTDPMKYGEVAYELGAVSINGGYYDAAKGNAEVKGGKLILPIQAVETDKTGKIGTVTVQVTSGNITDFALTINVEATNKTVPNGAPTLSKNTLAWGEKLSAITLSGTMKDGDAEVKGTFVWTNPETTPDSMSDFEAEWKFTPTDTAVYAETSGKVTIKVIKATPKGVPGYTKITTTGKTLADAALTKGNIQPADGEIKWEQGETTVVTANTAYKWVFTPNDKEHYNELTGFITPYSVSSSTGGSSGGGGSSSDRDDYDSNPVIKTETKNHPDGSTTKTETRKDGTVTATTTGKDGGVSKTETKKDGSSVTENKAADGSTGTIKTDKNGQTEAKTALSNKAVEDAKRNGEAVKAPVEVEASRNSSTAPTVKVELPKGAGETKVEIPVSNVKPGTVAVLVHPDGTEEILKDSIPTEDGIRLTVDGSATVKIVDNSKDFIDTQNHWAKDEIDFVSARELVNGISATRYAPNATATRAQLWTILARQNDADLNGGNTWYEKAQLWSKDKGISDGTQPDAAINRAQMVTMLWRTIGQPAAGGTANFIDVPADSYYAQAVAWAIENGITAGVGGGRFDPNSTCTRAQIATFLARSMK